MLILHNFFFTAWSWCIYVYIYKTVYCKVDHISLLFLIYTLKLYAHTFQIWYTFLYFIQILNYLHIFISLWVRLYCISLDMIDKKDETFTRKEKWSFAYCLSNFQYTLMTITVKKPFSNLQKYFLYHLKTAGWSEETSETLSIKMTLKWWCHWFHYYFWSLI